MKGWIILATWVVACSAMIAGAVLWDLAIKPRATIPEVTGETSYAALGLHELLKTARLRDDEIDPEYTLRVSSADSERLKEQLLHLGPKLGWYTQKGGAYDDIRATMPEQDIAEVEQMVRDPVAWVLENIQRDTPASAEQKGLINVTIDINASYGRTLWPIWAIVAGIIGLLLAAIGVLVMMTERNEEPEQTAKARRP